MAYASGYALSTSSVRISIFELQYPANTYSSFRVDVSLYSGSFIKSVSWISSSSGTSTSYNITGLSAGTSYTIDVYGIRGTNTWFINTVYVTTTEPIIAPGAPSWIALAGRTTSSLSIQWGSPSSGGSVSYYLVYCQGVSQGSTTSNSYTITGLSNNTTYYVCVQAFNNGGSSPTKCGSFTTVDGRPDPVTNLTASNITQTGFKISWDHSTLASSYIIYLNGVNWTNTSYNRYTFTGLTPGTNYTVIVVAVNEYGSKPGTSIQCRTTAISDWAWEYSIYSGGLFYAQNGKIAYLMPAYHWNDFTNKINEFRHYKGLSSYNFTTVYSEQSVTSSIINQAISAINDMLPSGSKIPLILSGSEVKASIFIDMRNKLNSII